MKRIVLAVLAVFVAWSALDFVIHGLILSGDYKATATLWRPMGEMKMDLMHLVVLVSATAFTCLYAWLVGEKNWGTGIAYGLVFGVATGISMGFGTYSVMPIPYKIALVWFVGSLVEATVAGLLVGLIVRK